MLLLSRRDEVLRRRPRGLLRQALVRTRSAHGTSGDDASSCDARRPMWNSSDRAWEGNDYFRNHCRSAAPKRRSWITSKTTRATIRRRPSTPRKIDIPETHDSTPHPRKKTAAAVRLQRAVTSTGRGGRDPPVRNGGDERCRVVRSAVRCHEQVLEAVAIGPIVARGLVLRLDLDSFSRTFRGKFVKRSLRR